MTNKTNPPVGEGKKKQAERVIKSLMGIPDRIQILGFYKGIPVLNDPLHPAPDGMIYFINESFIK